MSRPSYPFTALVGQEQMKLALLLNAVNPALGGVLIRGEKGTAKSTAVRALASLLPEIGAVTGCRFNCDPAAIDERCPDCAERRSHQSGRRSVPLVNLPVGATEDRLSGTIDLEAAIGEGRRRFEPGLLAAANRGILYVDEVNLLSDHLVDVLLDAAAMGQNYVEREGISISHAARFILVGTMNPEEGDLRPQLLDRFALAVEVGGLPDRAERAEVVRRRIAFEQDPVAFAAAWHAAEQAERARILAAQALLPTVALDDRMLGLITHLCCDFQVDGLRADIVMYKTASTLAAYAGRATVIEEDVQRAAELALPHRRRRKPFEDPRLDPDQISKSMDDWRDQEPPNGPDESGPDEPPESRGGAPETPEEQVFDTPDPYQVRAIQPPAERTERPRRAGRRGSAQTRDARGRYVAAAVPRGAPRSVALDATVRAAAPEQRRRPRRDGGPALRIEAVDVREKVRQARTGSLILFAVDASGSMAAQDRMRAAKQAVISLLLDAYQKRDRVGLITFRGAQAEVALPPTTSVDLAQRRLASLPTGGRTPLAHALQLGASTMDRHRTNHPEDEAIFVVVSDGRGNVALPGQDAADTERQVSELAAEIKRLAAASVVVDTESGALRVGTARRLSAALGARHLPVAALQAGDLLKAVRTAAGRA
ncbi:MAG: putative cobaltochelatase [Chloroflexota bacterium]